MVQKQTKLTNIQHTKTYKNRHISQWNIERAQKKKNYTYVAINLQEEGQEYTVWKSTPFLISCIGKTGQLLAKE